MYTYVCIYIYIYVYIYVRICVHWVCRHGCWGSLLPSRCYTYIYIYIYIYICIVCIYVTMNSTRLIVFCFCVMWCFRRSSAGPDQTCPGPCPHPGPRLRITCVLFINPYWTPDEGIPTGILICSYRSLRKSPETSGSLRENVI